MSVVRFLSASVVLGMIFSSLQAAELQPSLKWTIRTLAIDSNEGIDVGDFNRDGKLDVVAGRNWFAAPEFIPRPVRTIEDWNGYVESNGDTAYDVDGDGWLDVIAGSFVPTEVYWFRNPGEEGLRAGKMWEKQLLVDTQASRNESQMLHDLDGDGLPEWVVNSWKSPAPMLAWKFGTETRKVTVRKGKKDIEVEKTVPTLHKIEISQVGNGHGLAFGDVNGDGREDILCGKGWYERPEQKPFDSEWTFHADWDIHASNPFLVRDLDGDGRNDIIWSVAHGFGLYWWQQQDRDADGKIAWKEHLIDDKYSQLHCLVFVDLDGDGADELLTGKRVFAHNGKDPGAEMPPCLLYYEWDIKANAFHRHIIDEGTAGGGLQIRTGDLNGDGRLDIAVAGKSGTHILLNNGR